MMSSKTHREVTSRALSPTTKNFLNGPPVNPGSVHVLCRVVDAQDATSMTTQRTAAAAWSGKRRRSVIWGLRKLRKPACAVNCSARLGSAMLEVRLALLYERAHAFLLVVERKRCVELASLEQQAFRQRRFIRAVDRLLDLEEHGERERRYL